MQDAHSLFDIAGKVILITGGNKGIGWALSSGLAQAGASVVIVNRGRESGEAAVQAIQAQGGDAYYLQADLAEPQTMPELVLQTIQRYGRIDAVINNAAARINQWAEAHTAEDWDYILKVNVVSPSLLAQSAAIQMKRQGGGTILYVSSNLACRTIDRRSSYGATKGAIEALARHQALEWARFGIRVNCLAPGSTETPELSNRMRSDTPRYEALHQMIPLGRPARPNDMLGAAWFLVSAASEYMTGQTILVDGGWSIASMPKSVLFAP